MNTFLLYGYRLKPIESVPFCWAIRELGFPPAGTQPCAIKTTIATAAIVFKIVFVFH
ncbi:MAG: hypothetical protein IPL21_18910 [Saprospirales bacterium]|nr:hypothetical protein [Saprospirales bacterium]